MSATAFCCTPPSMVTVVAVECQVRAVTYAIDCCSPLASSAFVCTVFHLYRQATPALTATWQGAASLAQSAAETDTAALLALSQGQLGFFSCCDEAVSHACTLAAPEPTWESFSPDWTPAAWSQAASNASNGSKARVSGKDAFVLYDTYGFPLEITQELAAAQHVTVDVEGFTQEMQVCFSLSAGCHSCLSGCTSLSCSCGLPLPLLVPHNKQPASTRCHSIVSRNTTTGLHVPMQPVHGLHTSILVSIL